MGTPLLSTGMPPISPAALANFCSLSSVLFAGVQAGRKLPELYQPASAIPESQSFSPLNVGNSSCRQEAFAEGFVLPVR